MVEQGELLPCPNPWCAGTETYKTESATGVMLCCAKCDLKGPLRSTKEKARAAWNIRHSTEGQTPLLGEGLERVAWIAAEQAALDDYLEHYVLSTEGADYEPTEGERHLIDDALQGWLCEHDALLRTHLTSTDFERGLEAAGKVAVRLLTEGVPHKYYIEEHDDLSSMGATIRVPRTGPYTAVRKATAADIAAAIRDLISPVKP